MRQKTPSVLSLLFVFAFQTIIAQNLTPGTIALTTCNEDNAGNLSFITFVDLQVGTKIHLTDRGWDATTKDFAASNEGIITWTATTKVEALSEVLFSNVTSGILTVSSGTASMSGVLSMAAAGDQILIYQDPNTGSTTPNFIYLFNKGEPIITSKSGIKTSPIQTMIPESLILNTTAFNSEKNDNNWQFDCTDRNTGNKESLFMLFMDDENYNTNNNAYETYDKGAISQNGCSLEITDKDTTIPIINEQSLTVREDAPIGYEIGAPVVFDMAGNSFEEWEIVGGAAEDLFDIDEDTGIISVKDNSTFDFENLINREHLLEISVSDDSGNTSVVDAISGNGIIRITIEDYESSLTLVSANTTVQEGNSTVLTFTNTTPSLSPLMLKISTSGSATPGVDYKKPPTNITLAPNQETLTLTITTLLQTDVLEFDETAQFFALLLNNANQDISAIESITMFTIKKQRTLSLTDTNFARNLDVYPNPSKGILQIEYSDSKAPLTHGELYTLGGQLIATTPFDTTAMNRQIDITTLSSGMYILKLHSRQSSTAVQITKI